MSSTMTHTLKRTLCPSEQITSYCLGGFRWLNSLLGRREAWVTELEDEAEGEMSVCTMQGFDMNPISAFRPTHPILGIV